jgi:hypothetical protein
MVRAEFREDLRRHADELLWELRSAKAKGQRVIVFLPYIPVPSSAAQAQRYLEQLHASPASAAAVWRSLEQAREVRQRQLEAAIRQPQAASQALGEPLAELMELLRMARAEGVDIRVEQEPIHEKAWQLIVTAVADLAGAERVFESGDITTYASQRRRFLAADQQAGALRAPDYRAAVDRDVRQPRTVVIDFPPVSIGPVYAWPFQEWVDERFERERSYYLETASGSKLAMLLTNVYREPLSSDEETRLWAADYVANLLPHLLKTAPSLPEIEAHRLLRRILDSSNLGLEDLRALGAHLKAQAYPSDVNPIVKAWEVSQWLAAQGKLATLTPEQQRLFPQEPPDVVKAYRMTQQAASAIQTAIRHIESERWFEPSAETTELLAILRAFDPFRQVRVLFRDPRRQHILVVNYPQRRLELTGEIVAQLTPPEVEAFLGSG